MGQPRIGKGVESDLSANGEERHDKNGRPDSAERVSLHVGVNGSSRKDAGDVRDEAVRIIEKADMLDGEQGDHFVEFDGPAIHGVLYSQKHSGSDDGFTENLCDIATEKGDRMLLEEDEGSPAF